MIDYFDERTTPAQSVEIPVAIINDLDKPAEGNVTLSLLQRDKVVHEEAQQYTVPALGRTEVKFLFTAPAEEGEYLMKATEAGTRWGFSIWEMKIW